VFKIVGLFVLGGSCIGIALHQSRKLIQTYTSEEPPVFPAVEFSPEDVERITDDIEDFQIAVENDEPDQLVLTAEDLNILIASEPELAGRAHVEIIEDQITVHGGIPLEGIPGLSDRYIHGSFSSTVALEDGELQVYIQSFDLEDGGVIPAEVEQEIIRNLEQENFADAILQDEEVQRLIGEIETIAVENGQIIITR
jgi:hypothetical protein